MAGEKNGSVGQGKCDRQLARPNVLSLSRHVPLLSGSATRSVAQSEARKRRANERHVVGCCEELAGWLPALFYSQADRRERHSCGPQLFFAHSCDNAFVAGEKCTRVD